MTPRKIIPTYPPGLHGVCCLFQVFSFPQFLWCIYSYVIFILEGQKCLDLLGNGLVSVFTGRPTTSSQEVCEEMMNWLVVQGCSRSSFWHLSCMKRHLFDVHPMTFQSKKDNISISFAFLNFSFETLSCPKTGERIDRFLKLGAIFASQKGANW